MTSRIHVTIYIGIAFVIWGLLLWINGTPLTWDHFKPFSVVVAAMVAIGVAFDKWVWRWPILRGWLVKRPDIRGTWLVALKGDWENPETKEKIHTITCYMVVRQTLSTLSMRLMTQQSSSALITGKIFTEDDGYYRVATIYRNEPKLEIRGVRSEIHYGAFVLDIHGTPPNSLSGNYWTDRKTTGRINLSNRKKQLFSTFEEAAASFQN
jgi:hypothetical protein